MSSLMEHEVVSKYINDDVIRIVELDKDYGPATKFVGLLHMHNNHRYLLTRLLPPFLPFLLPFLPPFLPSLLPFLPSLLAYLLTLDGAEMQTIITGSYAMMMCTTRSQLGAATT